MEVIGEDLPGTARIVVARRPAPARERQGVEADPTRVQHPDQVVVRVDQCSRRLRQGAIFREDGRIHVPVGTDERKGLRLFPERPRNASHARVGVEESIAMEKAALGNPLLPGWSGDSSGRPLR